MIDRPILPAFHSDLPGMHLSFVSHILVHRQRPLAHSNSPRAIIVKDHEIVNARNNLITWPENSAR